MKRSLTADNTLPGIIVMIRDAVAFLKECGASPRALFIGELTLEEVLTNVVKYAYDDHLPHRIEVLAEVNDGRVRLEIGDDGVAFDPLAVPPPKLGEPAKTQRLGGRGIHLVKNFVKEVGYLRERDRNILTLVFPL